jgi:hypothetical protein
MYKIVNKIPQCGSTKTPINSEWRIFSLKQTYIVLKKLFSYIILSFQTILLIKYFSVIAQEGPLTNNSFLNFFTIKAYVVFFQLLPH